MISTKDQEREALNQIKEIVAGLGEGSYVAAAFEGCFELAEDNIGNDFARSMKQIADAAREENQKLEREVNNLSKAADERNLLNKENKAAKERINDLLSQSAENARKLGVAEEDNKALKAEIIQLKAKLYDYIMEHDKN